MINISLSPVAFGSITWYVIFYSMGGALVICAIWLLVKQGILPSYRFASLFAPVTVLFAVLFARLFYVIDMWEYYAQFPGKIFSLNGIYMNGALCGATFALWLCSRVANVNFGRCADAVTPAIIVGQMLGRAGCFLNGCCYGIETDLPWGITYTHTVSFAKAGVAYHPWQIYEILVLLMTLAIITRLNLKLKAPGLNFTLFLAMYAVWRFAGGFLRTPGEFFLGLQQAQVVSLVVLVLSVSFIWRGIVKQKHLAIQEFI